MNKIFSFFLIICLNLVAKAQVDSLARWEIRPDDPFNKVQSSLSDGLTIWLMRQNLTNKYASFQLSGGYNWGSRIKGYLDTKEMFTTPGNDGFFIGICLNLIDYNILTK